MHSYFTPWLLALFEVVGFAIAFIRLRPLHPAQLWFFSWGVASLLFALRLLPYRSLGASTVAVATTSSVAFAAGTFLGDAVGKRSIGRGPFRRRVHDLLAFRAEHLAVAVAAVTLAWLAAFLWEVARDFGLRSALVSSSPVRQAIGAGRYAVTIKYVYSAIACTTICATAAAQARRHGRRFGVLAIVAIVSTYFSTGRSTIVVAAIAGSVAFALARGARLRRRAVLLAALSVSVASLAVFLAGGALIGKTYANSDLRSVRSPFSSSAPLSLLALPYEYVSAPIAGLDIQVHATSTWGRDYGCATLSVVCRVLRTAGLHVHPEQLIRPFTSSPAAWNLYTGLDLPLIDVGPVLAPAVVLVLGIVSGLLWALATSRRILPVAGYALISTAIIFSSATNDFFAPQIVGAMIELAAIGAIISILKTTWLRATSASVGMFPS